MLVIGLTGGIGSGKSTVTHIFNDLGTPIIDADEVSREVVEPGRPALSEIASHFGDEMIGDDGQLNRKQLRQIIFNDPEQRKVLEAILHPRIRQRILEQIEQLSEQTPYCILSVPLLFESGHYDFVDRTLVIDIDEQLQITRTCERDGITIKQAEVIIATQMPRQQRIQQADDTIVNDGERAQLKAQVIALHKKYLELADKMR